ncbi:siphovirus Gp157 family protein [Desertifilum sp. FACHB-1129]|uniref:siphovirus Gp157 family protein n=1 Tax=unclassified Desertifilum TaxID=2621682 RepID=UPI001689996C|nr:MULTISPECIES: siphovirus Gp157 family protein [unclassified Desertifilum]MBD2311226.1 siphovirus Gp157 family protein [Desertifilum sp. FACHB-1129]MBD2324329.1 siphovirus Gp157 family protein [Desertifilum sp. FACHB-866]MBD2334343.1 siphovirus Gp157 family protein [Desertifilum sp. FACHB-868]MDA0213190.1 siphovirus Gp157 family protein [Cyanobacteria bacterium FC1]
MSRIPVSIALQSLQGVSHLAAQAWRHLSEAETSEQEASELEFLWQMQDLQEEMIDAHAELADQIDAEIAAITARLQHLQALHQNELERLKRWRSHLDELALKLNQQGVLTNIASGNRRSIVIKLNPPSCQVVDLDSVPARFMKVQTIEKRSVDKAAIKAAWRKGNPVPGTEVIRHQKVVYEIVPNSLQRLKAQATEP